MVKKKDENPRREVTKRQLSRWQQQKRRQRLIFGLGIFVIVSALVVVGVGWYVSQYQPRQQTVIKVNDTEFDMGYYVKALEFYARGQPVQLMSFLISQVEKNIQQGELIRKGAMKLGFSISDKEVDEELKSHEPPHNDVHRDVVRTGMLADKLRDEYFDQKVPMFDAQRHIMAMFLESESQVIEVGARLEDGEDFGALADELSLEGFSKTEQGDLGWHLKGILTELLATSILDDYAFSAEVGVLSQPMYDETRVKSVGYWLIEVLEKKEESDETHVRAILSGSEEEAQQVKSRLEAGEDFAALAEEFSQHEPSKEAGGDLDWLTPGMVSLAFDEFVFDFELEMETLSEPLKDENVLTKGGYWLVKILDKDDNRKLDDSDRELLKAKAFDEWISSLWDDPENKVESYLDAEKKAWAVERASRS